MVVEKGAPKNNSGHNAQEDGSDEMTEAEFSAINQQLDQLNGWIDHLEQKNADIQAQLMELLLKSKNTREEFQKTSSEPTRDETGTEPK